MRFISIFAAICITFFKVQAQQDSVKKTTITFAGLYGSNVSYYGQATSENFPYVLGNVTVRFPIGLYLSAGSYKLLNYGTGLSETDLGAGFDYDFGNNFSTGIAYTHSFFPANSPLLQASNENNISLSVKYDWHYLKSSVNADYAFGKQNDIFLNFSHAKEIIIGTLWSEKNIISIAPAVELIAGTQHFYESYVTEKNKRDKANGKGKSSTAPGNTNSSTVVTVPYNRFNLLSYNFKLPLTLSRANYLAEISCQLSLPGSKSETGSRQLQSFFGLAFYYQF